MTDTTEVQTEKEQTPPRKPDGILTNKNGEKTFVTELYFDHDSKDTFQDKLLKVIRSEQAE